MHIIPVSHLTNEILKTLIAVALGSLSLFSALALSGCDIQPIQPVPVSPQPLVSISHVDCGSEDLGRAMISENGKSAAIQCRDKTVKIWTEGSRELVNRKSVPLFLAAREALIIPSTWRCPDLEMHENPLAFDIRFSDANDCDVIDHTEDNVSYIVNSAESGGAYIVTPLGKEIVEPNVYTAGLLESLREKSRGLPYYPTPTPILGTTGLEVRKTYDRGIFLPRLGLPTEFVTPTLDRRRLEALALDGHSIRPVISLKMPLGLPWEDTDSTADRVSYSSIHKLIIVQCRGIFRFYRGDMTYVRAYSLDGTEQWTIRKPTQESGEYAMGSANVLLFAEGRFATVGYWNRAKDVISRPSFDVVDIKDGTILGSFDGWPIATSARANRVVVESMSKDYKLFDYSQLIH